MSVNRPLCITLEREVSYPKGRGEGGPLRTLRATEMAWEDEYVEIFNPNVEKVEVFYMPRDNIRAVAYLDTFGEYGDGE